MIGILLAAGVFSISSPAFSEGGNIPPKFTCDAGQTAPSPALAWKDAPSGTKSFVLIMDDPDVPMPNGFTHWVLADIPGSAKELPEGFQVGSVGVSREQRLPAPGLWRPVSADRRAPLSFQVDGARRRHDRGGAGRKPRGCREGDAGPRDRHSRNRRAVSEATEVVSSVLDRSSAPAATASTFRR